MTSFSAWICTFCDPFTIIDICGEDQHKRLILLVLIFLAILNVTIDFECLVTTCCVRLRTIKLEQLIQFNFNYITFFSPERAKHRNTAGSPRMWKKQHKQAKATQNKTIAAQSVLLFSSRCTHCSKTCLRSLWESRLGVLNDMSHKQKHPGALQFVSQFEV